MKKFLIKYPIKYLNERMTFLSGNDANGYTLRCGIMPKERGVLQGYSNDNKDWIEVKDVLFFDGQWSVVPRSKFEGLSMSIEIIYKRHINGSYDERLSVIKKQKI